jgi:hypothetical protein
MVNMLKENVLPLFVKFSNISISSIIFLLSF